VCAQQARAQLYGLLRPFDRYELGGDADLRHAPFKHIADCQLTPDLLYVGSRPAGGWRVSVVASFPGWDSAITRKIDVCTPAVGSLWSRRPKLCHRPRG